MKIRSAGMRDRDDIRRVYLRAFPAGENEIVAGLALDLLLEQSTPPTISLVAEADAAVVGHVAFSPVAIGDSGNCQGYILAPLAVEPDYQRRRIGSALTEYGVRQLMAAGVDIMFVYGDPGFYGRFGFSADAAVRYKPVCEPKYPFGWQALVVNRCAIEEKAVAITCVSPLQDPGLW
jgi:putative acetyltransferase